MSVKGAGVADGFGYKWRDAGGQAVLKGRWNVCPAMSCGMRALKGVEVRVCKLVNPDKSEVLRALKKTKCGKLLM